MTLVHTNGFLSCIILLHFVDTFRKCLFLDFLVFFFFLNESCKNFPFEPNKSSLANILTEYDKILNKI